MYFGERKILVFMNGDTHEIVRCERWDAVPLPDAGNTLYGTSKVTGCTCFRVDRIAEHCAGAVPGHVDAELQRRGKEHFYGQPGKILICWMTSVPMQ
jgi:hypothetical protein